MTFIIFGSTNKALYLQRYNDFCKIDTYTPFNMIDVEDAIQQVIDHSGFLGKCTVHLNKGFGQYLAEDIFSPINMPPFRQSAMDGYALNLKEGAIYDLIGEIKAGDCRQHELKTGGAVRVFTGSPVPDSANAVVVQEKVVVNGPTITIETPIKQGDNIRPLGEQVKKGNLALKKGTKLTPAAIGYLASLGIAQTEVYKKPAIAIVATGNELVGAGQDLPYGKIYESNATMLLSALNSIHYNDVALYKVEDDLQSTRKILDRVITEYDVVIITGGISVGEYDFVGKALQELAVQQIFHKVRQKPGKPLFFGKKEGTSIFALPGNPAAALTCFYVYVYPALQKMSGDPDPFLYKTVMRSASAHIKKGDRAQFLKARATHDKAIILEGQSSAMLQTFALANALLYVPMEGGDVHIGDVVEVLHLP